MRRPAEIPDSYSLSEILHYGRGGVDIYTDGEHLIFVNIRHDTELGPFPQTVSKPAKIGNVSY